MRSRLSILLLSAATLSGCNPFAANVPAPTTQPVAVPSPQAAAATGDTSPSLDPIETQQRLFRIEIYQFAIPAGTISANAAFWKPVEETFLGFNVHQALDRNGIRVGRVPLADITPVLGQLRDATVDRDTVVGPGGKKEIELRTEIPSQTLFWYDPTDFHLDGRDYGKSTNLYVVAYRQLPRRPDYVRVSFAPAIRELRPQLHIEDGGKVSWNPPDTIYSLGISCDLGADECVVIAPSKVATQNSLVLGRAFLMEDGPAQRLEHVLVIVPRIAGLLNDPHRAAAQ